jgi:glyoxylase-like metal-dependent hydrolase (beta-lactamase superfamily II)
LAGLGKYGTILSTYKGFNNAEVFMKNLMNVSVAMMAISVAGGAGTPAKASTFKGRVIEFKSGPEGFDTKTFFYEGENEVVAFDAQFTPALAEQAIARLREFTNKPLSWLVITHPNPDKFNGAPVFQKQGAKVIASNATVEAMPGVHAYKKYYFEEMAKMFKKGEYPALATVDQSFEGQADLVLKGGERIHLRELSQPGVSSNQTVASVESIQALFVGDLVHHRAHAWLEGGIVNGKPTPTLQGWVADLSQLKSLYAGDTMVYGGRGDAGILSQVAEEQIRYLQKADGLVADYVQALGKTPADYQALQGVFEKAFPNYSLGYMIQYGAYGLVNSKM